MFDDDINQNDGNQNDGNQNDDDENQNDGNLKLVNFIKQFLVSTQINFEYKNLALEIKYNNNDIDYIFNKIINDKNYDGK